MFLTIREKNVEIILIVINEYDSFSQRVSDKIIIVDNYLRNLKILL